MFNFLLLMLLSTIPTQTQGENVVVYHPYLMQFYRGCEERALVKITTPFIEDAPTAIEVFVYSPMKTTCFEGRFILLGGLRSRSPPTARRGRILTSIRM